MPLENAAEARDGDAELRLGGEKATDVIMAAASDGIPL